MDRIDFLLKRWAAGDAAALTEIIECSYERLLPIARGILRNGCQDKHLEPCDLVSGAWARLRTRRNRVFQTQEQFLKVAAWEMRHFMLNAAERAGAIRRGGQVEKLSLDGFFAEQEWE